MVLTTGSGEECALTIACEKGDLEMVKALLPEGPRSVNLSEAKWTNRIVLVLALLVTCMGTALVTCLL